MKALSIIGFIISFLALAASLYLHFVIAPHADMLETIRFNDYNDIQIDQNSMAYLNLKVDLGILVMFTGLFSLLLSIYPAIKKNKLAWVGVLFSLISAIIGAAYGTHMFS